MANWHRMRRQCGCCSRPITYGKWCTPECRDIGVSVDKGVAARLRFEQLVTAILHDDTETVSVLLRTDPDPRIVAAYGARIAASHWQHAMAAEDIDPRTAWQQWLANQHAAGVYDVEPRR